MGPQWGVRVHKACAWVRLQIEGCRDVEFTYPTHLWQAVDFGVRQLHEHVVVGLESVRVGVGAGAPALEVGPADEAGVNVYVGQRHAAAFLKVEVQVDSAGPGDAIRAAYGPAPCAQAVPRVCAEVLRLRIAVATWFRQYTCDADSPRAHLETVSRKGHSRPRRVSRDRVTPMTGSSSSLAAGAPGTSVFSPSSAAPASPPGPALGLHQGAECVAASLPTAGPAYRRCRPSDALLWANVRRTSRVAAPQAAHRGTQSEHQTTTGPSPGALDLLLIPLQPRLLLVPFHQLRVGRRGRNVDGGRKAGALCSRTGCPIGRRSEEIEGRVRMRQYQEEI